ncbi:MAG: adenylylsulfate kinase [Lachnospiraceae bacterium]|nr:adenylylsulfate kinase [Lachnospiraceae bacterium]
MRLKELTAETFENWQGVNPPADIPHGDMPGDKVEIEAEHIEKAKTIFPLLMQELMKASQNHNSGKVAVAVCGGSGVGKSEIASLLSFYLREAGIGAYTLSGDNYPHRIPMYNDAERLKVFREAGMRAMAKADELNAERVEIIRNFQREEKDADSTIVTEYPWYKTYLTGGEVALDAYLGTPKETDFAEVSQIVKDFHDGDDSIYLRRMGREDTALWYEKVDFSQVDVLLVEWTHGNSDYLEGIDVPVLLNSTPEETLAHRRARNRDGKLDSPFTTMVLRLEQAKLHQQAKKAKIILSKKGEVLSFADYEKIMEK